MVDGIFEGLKTGGQWERLPKDFPNHNRVDASFGHWREQVESKAGGDAQPRAASLERQRVKTTAVDGERHFDGGKQVQRRKRHVRVDSLGHWRKGMVTVAKRPWPCSSRHPCPASSGSSGAGVAWVAKPFKHIILRADRAP